MQIHQLNNQVFSGKNFRLPVKYSTHDRVGTTLTNFRTAGKYIYEYSNPEAKELYIKAQKTSDIIERTKLYHKMGHPEVKKMNLFEKIKDTFKEIFMKHLF